MCEAADAGRWLRDGPADLSAAIAMAREENAAGLLVKAQHSANVFFEALGFERLPAQDYPHRWWMSLDSGP